MTWQTDLLDWMHFPWCCKNVDLEREITDLPGFYEPGEEPDCPDGDEVAVFCKAKNYRILTSECLGMKCPDCRLHHHDQFIQALERAQAKTKEGRQ